MRKIYKVRIISAIVYTIFLIAMFYFSFFYESHGYAGGRARGGATGIILILAILPIGIAVKVFSETRSIRKVLDALSALLLAILDLPWFETVSKKWRKLRKQVFSTTKKQQKTKRKK
jgi:uncharacterized membrane protein